MPFVKVTRDKRGYEHVYLMHTVARRGKPARQRILYWFRTPPGVKVGRKPFDESVRRSLEAQNPDITFDWPALSNIAPPPPDVEHWRERRRLEKAAKLARRAEALAESGEPEPAAGGAAIDAAPEGSPADLDEPAGNDESSLPETLAAPAEAVAGGGASAAAAPEEPGARTGRRRRRGGRRRRRPGSAPTGVSGQPASDGETAPPPEQPDPEESGAGDGDDVA